MRSTRAKMLPAALAALLAAAGCNGTVRDPGALELLRPPPEKGAPKLSAREARALFRLARMDPLKDLQDRQALRRIAGLPPRMWQEHRDFVIVSLYLPGRREPLTGAALGGNLAFSVAGAARIAAGSLGAEELKAARVRIDLLCGGITPCGPRARMVPGVDGLAAQGTKGYVFLTPDRFLSDEPDLRRAQARYATRLEKLAGLPPGTWRQGKMMLAKFRARALLELSVGAEPVFLYRGNALVKTPVPQACRRSAEKGLAWLAAASGGDGRLPRAYLPHADRYEKKSCSAELQAGAASALLEHARLSGSKRHLAAGEKALACIRGAAVRDKRYEFTYVPGEGGGVTLGAAAMTLLALIERERAAGDASHRELMKGLAAFILQQQTPTGEFLAGYHPVKGRAVKGPASPDCPGQAILALVRLYELGGRKDRRLLDAAGKGARYLADLQRRAAEARAKAGAGPARLHPPDAWFMQALEALLGLGENADYARHLADLADGLVAAQLRWSAVGNRQPAAGSRQPTTRYPDLAGALDEPGTGTPSVRATAARCRGLLAALRALSGKKTAAYARALSAAARFVVQNQFRPENAYALPAPGRALGGFRLSPLADRVGIGCVQHCAAFLLEWAECQEPAAPGKQPG